MTERADPMRTEGFIGRWSRLKRGEAEAVEPALPVQAAPAPAADLPAPPPEPPALTDADMPPLETLGAESDFSCFMSSGVSEQLRQQALKKLFGLPICQVLDGLNDYDDDFTQLEPLGDTITYQMKQWAEREAREQLADSGPDGQVERTEATPEPAPAIVAGGAEAEPLETTEAPRAS